MSDFEFDFEVNENDETVGGYEPIPAGSYAVTLSDAQIKVLSEDRGYMATFVFVVVGGEYDNRKIFMNCNYGHVSEKARAFAKKQIVSIIKTQPKDIWHKFKTPDDLRNIVCGVKVVVKSRPGYPAQNEIVEFLPIEKLEQQVNPKKEAKPEVTPW